MTTIQIANSEIRLDSDTEVDEIVVRDGAGNVLFHLERMDNGLFWSAVYDPASQEGARVDVNFSTRRGHVIYARYDDLRELILINEERMSITDREREVLKAVADAGAPTVPIDDEMKAACRDLCTKGLLRTHQIAGRAKAGEQPVMRTGYSLTAAGLLALQRK